MSQLRFISVLRVLGASALWCVGSLAGAASMQAVSLRQSSPGVVTVTVRAAAETPKADAFSLELGRVDAPVKVRATQVEAADELSPALASAVLLCIDRSGSMHPAIPAIKAALKDVFTRPRPDLRIAVMSFGSDTPAPTPYFGDTAPLLEAIDAIRGESGPDGRTHLYDAIDKGLSSLADAPVQGEKRLVLITDGKDEGSRMREEQIAARLAGHAVSIGAIAFGPVSLRVRDRMRSWADGGSFTAARNANGLVEAMNVALGSAPPPAYDVSFRYAPAPDAPALDSALLSYAAPAAPELRMRVSGSIAAPLASTASVGLPMVRASTNAGAASAVVQGGQHRPGLHEFWPPPIGKTTAVAALAGFGLLLTLAAWMRRRTPPVRAALQPAPDARPAAAASNARRASTSWSAMYSPPVRGRPAALLTSDQPRRNSLTYAIEQTTVRIGGDKDNDLVIHDDYVSRRHAQIRFDSGSLYLTDLGSANGTFLNDTRVSGVKTLAPGDRIRFGRTVFEVRPAGDANRPHARGAASGQRVS